MSAFLISCLSSFYFWDWDVKIWFEVFSGSVLFWIPSPNTFTPHIKCINLATFIVERLLQNLVKSWLYLFLEDSNYSQTCSRLPQFSSHLPLKVDNLCSSYEVNCKLNCTEQSSAFKENLYSVLFLATKDRFHCTFTSCNFLFICIFF